MLWQKAGQVNTSLIFWGIVIALPLVIVVSLQHVRYLSIRRNSAQDKQSLFHSREAFHLITYFDIRDGEKILPATRAYLEKACKSGKPKLIYAGHAAYVLQSNQLGEHQWDGVLLHQYTSRAAYEHDAEVLQLCAAEAFCDHHFHGMKRNRLFSLLFPLLLLRLRIVDILSGKWRVEPLLRMSDFKKSSETEAWRRRVSRLRALHKINPHGLMVFNLVKNGNAKQRKADETYNRLMMSRMAALDHGPMHIGRAVGVQGNARFDSSCIVYYPSADYFADLLSSEYYQGIVDKNQVGDTMVVPTVPVTEQLLDTGT
jgi:hypothetical protein